MVEKLGFAAEPEVIQLPLTEKQPEVRLIPFAKVEEAVAEVELKMRPEIPPAKVEVAEALYAVTLPSKAFP